jgi:hypothetical protein
MRSAGLRVPLIVRCLEVDVALDATNNRIHHGDRLARKISAGGFGGQHYRIAAFIDRRRNIGGFGPGCHWRCRHRFEHLRCHHDGFPLAAARPHDPTLDDRNLCRRQFNPQVAARNHNAVCQCYDRIEIVDGRRLLQLRHDQGARTDQDPCLGDVFSLCTNESATQSAPSSSPKMRSRRSFSVKGDSGRTTPGTLTPFRSDNRPPIFTHVSA